MPAWRNHRIGDHAEGCEGAGSGSAKGAHGTAAATDPSLKELCRQGLNVLEAINSGIRSAKSDRNDRFFVQGLYDGALVSTHEDGHICIGDSVVVVFEHDLVDSKGRTKAAKFGRKREGHLWYGQVQSLSWFYNKKLRAVKKAHLDEGKASLVVNWYHPLEDTRKSHTNHYGSPPYVLPVHEQEGFNLNVEMSSVLSAVRMRTCPEYKCCLLHLDDVDYAQRELDRYNKFLNQSFAQKKKCPEFIKEPRPNHDEVKLQLDF